MDFVGSDDLVCAGFGGRDCEGAGPDLAVFLSPGGGHRNPVRTCENGVIGGQDRCEACGLPAQNIRVQRAADHRIAPRAQPLKRNCQGLGVRFPEKPRCNARSVMQIMGPEARLDRQTILAGRDEVRVADHQRSRPVGESAHQPVLQP